MSTFGKCGGGGRRVAKRLKAPLVTVVATVKESRPAVLDDLSATGARLHGSSLPDPGEDLLITVEGVHAFGTVAWADGDQRGIAFESPLAAGEERHLRQKVAQVKGSSVEDRAAYDDWSGGFAR
jgi:hypothetical protein